MAQQWVDITTINNSTPFTAVRWLGYYSIPGYMDTWFSEASGLTTDGMSWTQGTSAYGWFSAHRMNSMEFSCSFNHTGQGYWDESGIVYGEHVKDAARNAYYDSAVTIDNKTYYEIDFSQWSNAVPLYAPYSTIPWVAGQVYVYAGTPVISIDKNSISIDATGGTTSVTVTSEDDWTAVVSDNWVSISDITGNSGTTVVTITASANQTRLDRTATVTFSCNGENVVLTVSQDKSSTGMDGLYIGADQLEGLYLGDQQIEGLYLGDQQIF